MPPEVDPAAWGVATGYEDYAGRWRDSPRSTIEAVLEAMRAGPGGPPRPQVRTVQTGSPAPGRVVSEEGEELPPGAALPAGYHQLDGGCLLVASPRKVPLPAARQWGFAAQVYAARSTRSWGMGDLSDLARLNRWAAGLGAGFTLVNPLHAASPGQASPYYPGSRCFLNPLYVAVEDVPGAAGTPWLAEAAAAGRALNAERHIDRPRIWALKRPVLRQIFERGARTGFERWRREKGRPLERFATYAALAEELGDDWRQWPGERPEPAAADVEFHSWLQWVAEAQLEKANSDLGLVVDLAVGVDPGGADAWIWQDCFASGMRVGAPPDEFNTLGQDWGLPPFDPWRLRAARYEPWILALRAGIASGAGLRVDHVMGLFRLFWIPEGAEAAGGAYVRYPAAELLDILALEAERAGAFVVGEDLGTVEDEVRDELAERQVLSYRVWWFEDTPPGEWPEGAMGAVTTHDLPTVAGVWTGSDVQAQRDIGTKPNEESMAALREKVERRTGLAPGAPVEEVVEGVYRDLAGAPCRLLVATLDDVVAVEERPNMPGTTDAWPNWSIPLPVPVDDLPEVDLAARVAAHLARPAG